MLQNAYLLAKIGADTAENEQQFAEILPKIGNYPKEGAAVGHGLQAQSWAVGGGGWVRSRSGAGCPYFDGALDRIAGLSRDPTNFRGLVLGCIEAKFCK